MENETLCKLSISLTLKLKQMSNSPKVKDINQKKLGRDLAHLKFSLLKSDV